MRIFANPNYNFIKWRWHALIFSLAIIWIGVATIFLKGGIPLGIEFTGGTQVEVQFDQPTGEDVVRRAVETISKDAMVQQVGRADERKLLVRLPEPPQMGKDTDDGKRVEAALRAANVGSFQVRGTDIIGPVMGKDYQRKGILATVAALGGILVYVGFRFRFTFALGAIVAAFHDILITLVFLEWFHYELSLNVIAALLTITGYSVNDTIVVFDRVRENQRTMRREPLDQIVNTSVNQTLGRTVLTAGLTLLSAISLYVFGGEVLRGLSFTMIVGIVTGTYSTVFIAAAIAIILSRRTPVTQAGSKPAEARRRARA